MLFDLTANSNSRKIMALNPSYPQDVTKTVIKGNTVSATFKVVVSEPGRPDSYTYQWYVNGTAVSGANGSTYTRTGLASTDTYSVYCIVSNKAGSVKSRVATLKVTQYYTPVLNSSYPQNATVVKGTSVKSEVKISTAGNPASYTYQWYKNGSAVSGATSPTYTFTPTAVGTTTVYCKVTNAAGTVTSRTATITSTVAYLYNAGDQCTPFTGGWTKQESDIVITFDTSQITFRDSYGSNNKAATYTVNKIDVSSYTKLVIVGTDFGWLRFGITDENTSASPVFTAQATPDNSATTATLDLTGISGNYYVCISAFAYTVKANATQLYLD